MSLFMGKNNMELTKEIVNKDEKDYVYILVREDLTLAQQGVQLAHAGMLAVSKHGGLKEDTRLIVLKVKDQDHLLEYENRSLSEGVNVVKFHEPDYGIGYSALSTAPISRKMGRLFKKLPMWKP